MGLFDFIRPRPKPTPVDPAIARLFDRVMHRLDRVESNLSRQLEQRMSALSEKIDAAFAAVEAEHAQVTAAVDALKAEIAALKDQIATGGVTEGDLARLDELASAITGVYEPAAPVDPTA